MARPTPPERPELAALEGRVFGPASATGIRRQIYHASAEAPSAPRTDAAAGRIEVVFDASLNLRVVSFHGRVDDALYLDAYRRHFERAEYEPRARCLIDTTGVGGFDVTSGGMRAVAALASRQPRETRAVAVAVVASTPVLYGMWRMYEILRGLEQEDLVRVFRHREEAVDWLMTR